MALARRHFDWPSCRLNGANAGRGKLVGHVADIVLAARANAMLQIARSRRRGGASGGATVSDQILISNFRDQILRVNLRNQILSIELRRGHTFQTCMSGALIGAALGRAE